MPEIIRIDIDQARHNPQAIFATPQDLTACKALTRGQKISALEVWRDAVQQRLAATNEGMPPQGLTDQDVLLLQAIDEALESLRNMKPAAVDG